MSPTGIDTNRREIASAACDLVADSGLDNVSLRRIAKHLGSTTGYISHYYVDKEDLLEAALQAALDEVTTYSGEQSRDLDEWIDRAARVLPREGETQRFWRVLTAFQAASLNSDRLAEVLRNYAAEQADALARHLSVALAREASDPAVTALARSLFAMVSGLGTTSTLSPDAFTAAQHHAVVRAATYGLIEEFTGR